MSNTYRILLALVAGLALGAALGAASPPWAPHALAVARPIGRLWLDALQMTIVPLVFSLLVTGVASAAGTVAAGGVAGRAIGLFALLLLAAAALGALLTPLLLDLWPVAPGALGAGGPSGVPPIPPFGDWLLGFVPTNPIKAAAEGQMVPVVVFALIFGLAATRIDVERQARIVGLFDAVVETMLVVVRWVLWVAPLGVFALALGVGAGAGLGVAGALLHYVAIVVLVQLALLAATYALAVSAGRIGIGRFSRGVATAQIVGLSTQSSLASLPAMLEGSRARLGVPEAVRDTVLPLAVSLFRITSPAANMAVVVFVAAAAGVPLGIGQLVVGAGVAALCSLAVVGLPSQVSFFTALGPISLAMGVPLDLLPLLLAVETLPDLFRTLGNVTADMAVTRIVAVRTGHAA